MTVDQSEISMLVFSPPRCRECIHYFTLYNFMSRPVFPSYRSTRSTATYIHGALQDSVQKQGRHAASFLSGRRFFRARSWKTKIEYVGLGQRFSNVCGPLSPCLSGYIPSAPNIFVVVVVTSWFRYSLSFPISSTSLCELPTAHWLKGRRWNIILCICTVLSELNVNI